MKATTSGISGTTVLGIVFIVLKLTNTITWPWLWVLAPFWIPWALLIVILLIVLLIRLMLN